MKNLFIIGTRPEAIKMIPLVKESISRNNITHVCITGQHEIVNNILKKYNIDVDYNLEIMKENQSINYIFYESIKRLEENVVNKYDYIFVHGDTTSACAAAVWAFNNSQKVIHIEAGLRSHNNYDPFPEEMNRILIDKISDIHFAPSIENKNNLIKENVKKKSIFVVGNTVIDMLKLTKNMIGNVETENIVLITCHRRENFKFMDEIFSSINKIASLNKDYDFVYPLHPNKKIQEKAKRILKSKNIRLINALEYYNFLELLLKTRIVITDSGGVLEESAFLGKKVLIIRNSLERKELLSSNVILSNVNENEIINNFLKLKHNKQNVENNSYKFLGNGNTSIKIFDILEREID